MRKEALVNNTFARIVRLNRNLIRRVDVHLARRRVIHGSVASPARVDVLECVTEVGASFDLHGGFPKLKPQQTCDAVVEPAHAFIHDQ